MPVDKEKMKQDLMDESNSILKEWNEPFVVDTISVMNSQGKITFLGSLRIFDERNASDIIKEVKSKFAKFTIQWCIKLIPKIVSLYTSLKFAFKVNPFE